MLCRILSIILEEKKNSEGILEKFKILAIMGVGLVSGSRQSVKKEKFWMKQLMLNKVLESCKNDIGWYKN